ncbi:outer membrane beta-barrel protein [Candidatus Palauibacter polyketidifaciens]|uniref:outer membrane beta-barrel protein n=1 Tax=Candidatus Palauibacter polyketidifaciens TaxID=3056740 RepID=UPI00139BFE3A|nr:outer membrane beta-barrel protein [Candidatus Palauibacter polyketidifaciens]MDE2721277.1 outer membrane beta-barrel protein [Candidatus Palauibacter polyketidifaciens]MYE35162.1 PorT family protein [Gemmatimonadales bacterium]
MRRVVTSLLPLLIAAPLMGQATLGFRGGLSDATISSDLEDTAEQEARRGVVAGLDITFPVGSAVQLRIGGAYVQKGTNLAVDSPSEGIRGSTGIEADWVQASALVRIGTPRGRGASFGLLLGPWAASLISCETSLDFEVSGLGPVSESMSCDDVTTSTDFGVAAGAGVEMAISDGLRLGVDLIYSLGLANVDDTSDDTSMDTTNTRHLALQAGFVIPLGG